MSTTETKPSAEAAPKVTIIKPTVGRIVYFFPANRLTQEPLLAAIITAVWGERTVNLAVFQTNGVPMSHPPTSVWLVQPGEEPPKSGCYCMWMPYQIGKAAAEVGK